MPYNGSKVLCISGDNVKGAFRETAQAFRLTEQIRGLTGALQLGFNTEEWCIPLTRNDKPVTKPDELVEFFLPPTFHRPTAAVVNAESIKAPVTVKATIKILSPLIAAELIRKIAELVGHIGFCAGRKHGYGKAKLVDFQEQDGQSRRKS